LDLPGGAQRYVDLVEVRGTQPSQGILTVTSAPREGLLLLSSRAPYELRARLVGDNVQPRTFSVTVNFYGTWPGDADSIPDHLSAHCSDVTEATAMTADSDHQPRPHS